MIKAINMKGFDSFKKYDWCGQPPGHYNISTDTECLWRGLENGISGAFICF